MTEKPQPMSILPESECWDLLAGVALGRLVTSVDGKPAIFPVNFAVQGRSILFRTAEGTKLVSAAMNKNVLFEADGYTAAQGWSVIVDGTAKSLREDEDIAEAEQAGLLPWTATEKSHYIRIRPLRVTGRRFRFCANAQRTLAAEDPVLG
ncbi:MAG: pyridoxamine 5'-phosphate oxidase family protein [Actinomycetota bacterium]|nr:pyridoxamine 5'-phosphate oxidase family protein [Actinomycetota bacterium]